MPKNIDIEKNTAKAVLLIGHGSRFPESREVLEAHAERIKKTGKFDEIHICFLQSDPTIQDVFPKIKSETIIVFPFFLAPGIHVSKDIPRLLCIQGKYSEVNGKNIIYCAPLGKNDLITQAILQQIEEAERSINIEKTKLRINNQETAKKRLS